MVPSPTRSDTISLQVPVPGWIVPVCEIFCKQAGILVGFLSGFVLLVIFRKFLPWFCFICYISALKPFILKIKKSNSTCSFLNGRSRKKFSGEH